jgi:hypothetical protein
MIQIVGTIMHNRRVILLYKPPVDIYPTRFEIDVFLTARSKDHNLIQIKNRCSEPNVKPISLCGVAFYTLAHVGLTLVVVD